MTVEEPGSWEIAPGDEFVPGRVVHRLLGGGRAYEAYLAFDETLYAPVVVKALRPGLVGERHSLRQMAREAELLGRLNHPVIVRSFDAVLDGERPHLVLEHLEGPRLSRLLRKHGRLSLEQLLPLTLELSSALHYLARSDVVHLDVKPSNTIMGSPPRLIDLSVARSVEAAAALEHVVGTDYYLAPEQAEPSAGAVGPPADVWGLGATIFEAWAGQKPWSSRAFENAQNGSRAYPQVSTPPRELPRGTPPALRQLIVACLDRAPQNRPTAAEVAEAVEPLVAALPRPVLGGFRPRPR